MECGLTLQQTLDLPLERGGRQLERSEGWREGVHFAVPPLTPPRAPSARDPPPSGEGEAGGLLLIMYRRLTPVLGTFFLDISEVLIENDPVFAGECNEALATRAADQRQVRLARKLDTPGGETGA